MRVAVLFACLTFPGLAASGDLESARDKQDRAALAKFAGEAAAAAAKAPKDATVQYKSALANSYLAEVATEMRDKGEAQRAAETGIQAARAAVAVKPDSAEYHRILGALCGQVIPANVLLGAMKYGKCAQESINKAIELDGKSSLNYLSRGIGNYYLPAQFGGGVDVAIKDFDKAIQLDPKNAEAYLWRGIALRKANKNAEAREALEKALKLNPNRVWTKQQLDKTPAK
jgi:tetratricopeptide (TPR) repeat protein